MASIARTYVFVWLIIRMLKITRWNSEKKDQLQLSSYSSELLYICVVLLRQLCAGLTSKCRAVYPETLLNQKKLEVIYREMFDILYQLFFRNKNPLFERLVLCNECTAVWTPVVYTSTGTVSADGSATSPTRQHCSTVPRKGWKERWIDI